MDMRGLRLHFALALAVTGIGLFVYIIHGELRGLERQVASLKVRLEALLRQLASDEQSPLLGCAMGSNPSIVAAAPPHTSSISTSSRANPAPPALAVLVTESASSMAPVCEVIEEEEEEGDEVSLEDDGAGDEEQLTPVAAEQGASAQSADSDADVDDLSQAAVALTSSSCASEEDERLVEAEAETLEEEEAAPSGQAAKPSAKYAESKLKSMRVDELQRILHSDFKVDVKGTKDVLVRTILMHQTTVA